ncbi:MAG: hypothetical protein JW982_14930 [Spirochaetes bacterium]|nr:hypothetical protein [Spirochaetota bacterium]
MKNKLFLSAAFFFCMSLSVVFSESAFRGGDLVMEPLSAKTMEYLPVTRDFRNYFILQSIDDVTNIIIGDFVGADILITVISDLESDGKADKFYEWYPQVKKKKIQTKPTTPLYEGDEKTKEKIISGEIFRTNYSYKMSSLDSLKYMLKKGTDIVKYEHGYAVRIFDPEKPTERMSEFFFGRKNGRYDLQFKTNYYKLYNTVIKPPIPFSVYCVNSKDKAVKDTVEELIKIVEAAD